MLRCLELGRKAIGTARPNPAVGACIVHNNSIIGEGFTSPFGGPHAEVNAIANVRDKSLLREATLYVSLEPCSHQGKTPPCTNAILAAGIPEVVIGIGDPNVKVNGQGIRMLQEAGCTVTTGVAAPQCREHHKRFLSLHEKSRPYIILKWAQSKDGFMAPDTMMRQPNEPFWLTGKVARQRVHQWRSEEQAILVGANTILADDPGLTVRNWEGENPVRIILDKEGVVKKTHRVCNEEAPTWIYTENAISNLGPHVDVNTLNRTAQSVQNLLRDLSKKKVSSVFVEGGAQTLHSFLEEGLWDEARIFKAPMELKSGLVAPTLDQDAVASENVGRDTLYIYRNDS